jgi:hypothetical protein
VQLRTKNTFITATMQNGDSGLPVGGALHGYPRQVGPNQALVSAMPITQIVSTRIFGIKELQNSTNSLIPKIRVQTTMPAAHGQPLFFCQAFRYYGQATRLARRVLI